MKKKVLYISLIIIVHFCMSMKPEKDYNSGRIEILQVKNENLLPLLDSIVNHEKNCIYYKAGLFFSIRSRIINDTISEFQIGACGLELLEFGDNHYKGCFKHKGHWFFVEGQDLNETVFCKTNQKKRFMFYKPEEITENGEIFLRVIEDDTYSFWIYHYIDNGFILKEMYDSYCIKQL